MTAHDAALDRLSDDQLAQVDFLCDACDVAWRSEPDRPRLDDVVRAAAEALRPALRGELARLRDELADDPTTVPTPGGPDGYELLDELDRGTATVYRAREIATGREVAVKIVAGAGELERIDRLRTMRLPVHPALVPIERFGPMPGGAFLVMPVVPGRSLARRLGEYRLAGAGPTPAERQARRDAIAALVQAVAEGVAVLHRHGILHRDLKPGNILLDADGTPRICDFGLARRVAEFDRHTASAVAVGTVPYMAPEVLAGQDATTLSDLWSLGAVLYELLAGHAPFNDGAPAFSELHDRKQHRAEPAPLGPAVDADLAWICRRCLDRDPARRFRTVDELADVLRSYRAGARVKPRETWAEWLDRRFRIRMREAGYPDRWRSALGLEAATNLACHVGAFALLCLAAPGWVFVLWLLFADLTLGWAVWRWVGHGRDLTPMERDLHQLGYGTSLAAVVLLLVHVPLAGPVTPAAMAFYPGWAVLVGLAFFVESRLCSPGLYQSAALYFALAFALAAWPWLAPAAYGTAYCLNFGYLALTLSSENRPCPDSAMLTITSPPSNSPPASARAN